MSYWMGAISKNTGISREPSGPEPTKLSEDERKEVARRLDRKRQDKIRAGKRTYQTHLK